VLIFLDTNIVIYFVEQMPDWGALAAARVNSLRSAGDQMAVSDLVRMECHVGPLLDGDAVTLAAFDAFFALPEVRVVGITSTMCDRAAAIRAAYRFRPMDALHLAAAVEAGCDVFLTNDNRLSGFPDVRIEVLA